MGDIDLTKKECSFVDHIELELNLSKTEKGVSQYKHAKLNSINVHLFSL